MRVDQDKIKCPHCGEIISRGIEVCGYCGKDVILFSVPEETLEEVVNIISMCRVHWRIGASLVQRLVEEVKDKRLSAEEAALKIAEVCNCGMVDPVKVTKIIERIVLKECLK